ncbi:hypothetical protein F9U42_07335 [Pectobacterium versatile]|nr:hypothetical protein [Pectobacterium versatile]
MTFASCDKAGDYFVVISDPNTISDMPEYKGQKLYGYGVLHVSQRDHFVGQEYTSHNGDYAWRQKWNNGVYAPWIVALSSSRVPTAADVGAVPFSGGKLTGELISDNPDNYRISYGDYGVYMRNDGASFYTLLTNKGEPYGSYNALRPFRIHLKSGDVQMSQNVEVDGILSEKGNRVYSPNNKPAAVDIGAITKKDADNNYVRQGLSGVIYQKDDLPWNSPTGVYLKDNATYSSLIWHMGANTGSASAAQFYFDFANGGIKYRSSRDNFGFEKPWARIYSDQDKPTADDIGALSLNEIVGIPMPWPQATAPSGWLKCNGQAFDKNTYPILGQAYPSGILPDLRGEFIRGWDDGRGVDTERTLLSSQQYALQAHTHPAGTYNQGSGTPIYAGVGMPAGGDVVFSKTRENENSANETRPRNISFNYIVRAA